MPKLSLSKLHAVNPFKSRDAFSADGQPGGNGHPVAWAVAAGAVGGTGGGIGAYELSQHAIESQPAHTVTVSGDQVTIDGQTHTVPENYQTMVTQDKVLGQIPSDTYMPGGWWGVIPTDPGLHDVHSSNYGGTPVMDANGKAEMQEGTKTFNGHGNPVVDWQTHTAQSPYLDPHSPYSMSWSPSYYYTQQCTPQYHSGYTDPGYYDSNGNYHAGEYHPGYTTEDCQQVQHIQGYWVYYSPNVHYQTVQTENGGNTYQTPDVHFENGVHTALNTVLGSLGGFALAGLATYFIKSAMSK